MDNTNENTDHLLKFVEWLHVVGYLRDDLAVPYESIIEHYEDEKDL